MTDHKITPELLDELEALEQAATPGKWVENLSGIDISSVHAHGKAMAFVRHDLDAAFIADSRNALPALIQEVRRLRWDLESAGGKASDLFDEAARQKKRAIKAEAERDALAKELAELHEINVMLVDGAPEGSHTAEYWIKWAEQQTKEEK